MNTGAKLISYRVVRNFVPFGAILKYSGAGEARVERIPGAEAAEQHPQRRRDAACQQPFSSAAPAEGPPTWLEEPAAEPPRLRPLPAQRESGRRRENVICVLGSPTMGPGSGRGCQQTHQQTRQRTRSRTRCPCIGKRHNKPWIGPGGANKHVFEHANEHAYEHAPYIGSLTQNAWSV